VEHPSDELRSPETFVAMFAHVLDDAMTRFTALPATTGAPAAVEFPALAVYSFKQTWPDSGCGFGGIALQVLTDAQTVVVSWAERAVAAVYIRGEFAYLIDAPTSAFWEAVHAAHLPGAAERRDHLGG
jgi:hypothetical protein